VTLDAVGPETFTYRELVRAIGEAIGRPRPIVGIPPRLGLLVARTVGWIKGDVLVTREEIAGLLENRLFTGSPATGRTRLSEWLRENAADLGRAYSSELGRRRDRERSYETLRRRGR
jgi:NADH dehydrogenase